MHKDVFYASVFKYFKCGHDDQVEHDKVDRSRKYGEKI